MLDNKQILWVDSIDLLTCKPPSAIHHWMANVYRISSTLKKSGCDVQVNVLSERKEWVDEEARIFAKNPPLDCWVRQIYLEDAKEPLTYGRVTVPWQEYLTLQDTCNNLGDKPIGEALLYSDPNVVRDAFQYALIDEHHALFHALVNPRTTNVERLWGRRSLFSKANARLLVTEFYLPAIDKVTQ